MSHVLLLGATGTIGRATAAALLARGHRVTAPVRPGSAAPPGCAAILAPLPDWPDAIRAVNPDALISCLASRTGAPADAWAIDHAATVAAIDAAHARHVVLLSALCVQEPALAFQHAKLATESHLMASGTPYSIVRPTAFFKSLSGQLDRVRNGKPFLVFGDGRMTACKPISARDLAEYLVDCLSDPTRINRILPIGGAGPALAPLDQAAILSNLLGRDLPVRRVPVRLLDGIVAGLSVAGAVSPKLRAKTDLARIGRFYATRSMLVRNPETGHYDADATPETGADTLAQHYAALLDGTATDDRGDHAVF